MSDIVWHLPDEHPPEGEPVIAEYNPYNHSANPPQEQIVWFWQGEWRTVYANPDSRAWINRWRRVPLFEAQAARIARLEASIAAERDDAAPCDHAGLFLALGMVLQSPITDANRLHFSGKCFDAAELITPGLTAQFRELQP